RAFTYSNVTPASCSWTYQRLTDLAINVTHAGTKSSLENDYINFTITYTPYNDATPPIIGLVNPPNNNWSTISNNTFYFNVTDDNTLLNCSLILNSSINETKYIIDKTSTNNISSVISDGVWSWTINCTDNWNNTGTNTTSRTLKIDTTPPSINLENPLDNDVVSTGTIVDFYFNASDAMTNLSICDLVIDGVKVKNVTGPLEDTSTNISYAPSLGNHNWSINCTDGNGFENNSIKRNITINNVPNVVSIDLDDDLPAPLGFIDLAAGITKSVLCNLSVTDNDGYAHVSGMNATFFYYLNKTDDPDDNNTHYTNTNCTNVGNDGLNTKYFSCEFNISYYANNGSWTCNATAYDNLSSTSYLNTSSVINPLYALNFSVNIDFGDVSTANISEETNTSIINVGNIEIDIGLDAYGTTDNDGIAMNCTKNNISFDDMRYSLLTGEPFNNMNKINDTMYELNNFNLSKQINNSLSTKNIYWRIRPTPLSFGICTGVVVLTALA
ncbi:hypothetical protein GOV05_03300, partial [Candidatus Woesearchaeota archaeon]|nr:hypothetical protein [Candidatus Woesearchaeota archaeon]